MSPTAAKETSVTPWSVLAAVRLPASDQDSETTRGMVSIKYIVNKGHPLDYSGDSLLFCYYHYSNYSNCFY